MDSGMILEQERKPPFDPLIPLLPQELCWILDRSFACEVTASYYLRVTYVHLSCTSVVIDGMACWEYSFSNGVYSAIRPPLASD